MNPATREQDRLTIGVYPFGLAAGPDGLAAGPPDDLDQIRHALHELQGSGPPLLTRAYVGWAGSESTAFVLGQIAAIVSTGLMWDLVLAYRDRAGDVESWCGFVTQVVRDFGRELAAVQVTGEANLTDIPDAGDVAYPGAVNALAHGVVAAAAAKRTTGASLDVGFAVVPDPEPAASTFWPALATAGGPRFAASVDYAGIDMYPDVFGGPVQLEDLGATVDRTLRTFRETALPIVGISAATPIRICESGWPTGPDRCEQRQSQVLDTVLRSVHQRRCELNITHWELFTLRDADSARQDPFHQFGVLRDDYTPKVAFDRLRRTIAELCTSADNTAICTSISEG
jgi:hypothetical protein